MCTLNESNYLWEIIGTLGLGIGNWEMLGGILPSEDLSRESLRPEEQEAREFQLSGGITDSRVRWANRKVRSERIDSGEAGKRGKVDGEKGRPGGWGTKGKRRWNNVSGELTVL